MRRRAAQLASVLVVIVLAGLVLIGRPVDPRPVASVAPTWIPATSPDPTPNPEADLDSDIGAVMVFSWRAALSFSSVQPYLVRDRVGGALLFTSNFGGTPAGLKQWSDQLLALSSSECLEHPMLLMTDEEGGSVANMKSPTAPPWPLEMASYGADRVRSLEALNGAGLRAAGVGMDLAPVADVRTNPLDGVIGARSFGSSPSVVAPLVAAAVGGLHDGGVGATLKHFPGLGGAAGDPHEAIPTDHTSLSQWTSTELPAFASGIAAGADAVMVTAVYEPGLDGGAMPAMFSPSIVGRLRTQLGFNGVIMTDSLSMGGIGARWSLPDAAVLALAAGNDMLLLGNGDPAYEASAVAAVRAAVLSGRLDRARLHESALRDNALRDRWGRRPMPCRQPAAP
ncbi:MAG TPA: glycoside hydrolase family 3 N-terminal domain-containing protein [Candidatus Dormibacteraeota bacterium]|nr:glycoside hydrolase family 3 N-terminal domain-containing protein [Candidatus Dormibacteraeota bacterium]